MQEQNQEPSCDWQIDFQGTTDESTVGILPDSTLATHPLFLIKRLR